MASIDIAAFRTYEVQGLIWKMLRPAAERPFREESET